MECGVWSAVAVVHLDLGPTPPPFLVLISTFRTLLCTWSKARIAAHQFIQEEEEPRDWIYLASAPRRLPSTGHCPGHSLDGIAVENCHKRVEARAAYIGFECCQLFFHSGYTVSLSYCGVDGGPRGTNSISLFPL